METAPVGEEDRVVELLITIGAIVTGLATVVVGMFSLLAIWFEDLV